MHICVLRCKYAYFNKIILLLHMRDIYASHGYIPEPFRFFRFVIPTDWQQWRTRLQAVVPFVFCVLIHALVWNTHGHLPDRCVGPFHCVFEWCSSTRVRLSNHSMKKDQGAKQKIKCMAQTKINIKCRVQTKNLCKNLRKRVAYFQKKSGNPFFLVKRDGW